MSQVWESDDTYCRYETAVLSAESNGGAYSHGAATLSYEGLQPGRYALVPSCYDAGTNASYTLKIHSTCLIEPTLSPQEDAGRFVKMVRGRWTAATAGGNRSLSSYIDNPRFRIKVAAPCELRTRLVIEPSSLSGNVSVFANGGTVLGEEIVSSGPYAAYVAGVTTHPCRLRPSAHDYVAVVSSYTAGAFGKFSLAILTDGPVQVEAL